jgi:hypothetical protein
MLQLLVAMILQQDPGFLLINYGCCCCCRYGKPLDDGLEWPIDEPYAVAGIMHKQVQAMLQDMQQLAATFKTAAPAILQALQEAAAAAAAGDAQAQATAAAMFDSKVVAQQASAAAAEVDADCTTAVSHVKDGFGKLLYVVLLASLHHAGLQQPKGAEVAEVAAPSDAKSGDADAGLTVAAATDAAPALDIMSD